MPTEDQAWPFLIGRTRTQDHRMIVIPGFMTTAPIADALRRAANGESDPPGTARIREIRVSPSVFVTIVYRVFTPTPEDYGLAGDGTLKDEFGRSILLTEGLAVRHPAASVERSGVTQADLDQAHALVTPAYRAFWNKGSQFTRQSSDAFALSGRGTPLNLHLGEPVPVARAAPDALYPVRGELATATPVPADQSEGPASAHDAMSAHRTRARKQEPAIYAAWIAGILGVVGIVAGVFLTHVLGGSSPPSTTTSSPPGSASSKFTPVSSPATTASGQPETALSGTITVPSNGSTSVYVTEQLHASGTARNVPPGNHLELFLQYKSYPPFYAAGDPETVIKLDTSDGRWSGVIYIGEAEPCVLWLVDLTSAETQQMNREVSYQTAGYPTLPGTVLARVAFTSA
jgi:hypothetical protein